MATTTLGRPQRMPVDPLAILAAGLAAAALVVAILAYRPESPETAVGQAPITATALSELFTAQREGGAVAAPAAVSRPWLTAQREGGIGYGSPSLFFTSQREGGATAAPTGGINSHPSLTAQREGGAAIGSGTSLYFTAEREGRG